MKGVEKEVIDKQVGLSFPVDLLSSGKDSVKEPISKLVVAVVKKGYAYQVVKVASENGAKGAFIDNATAGGGFVGIDSNGVLKDKVFDKYARYSSVFNDIDFSKTHFQIPNFEVVKEFAKKISLRVPHMSLFAMDIVLDKNNVPKLIEVNTSSFTDYFLQLTEGPVFGNYTDDVISYCSDKKDNLSVSFKYVLLSDIKR